MLSHPCPTLSQPLPVVPQAEMFTGLIIVETIVKIISVTSIALGFQVQLAGSEQGCEHILWSLIPCPEQKSFLAPCVAESVEPEASSVSQSRGFQGTWWAGGRDGKGRGSPRRDVPTRCQTRGDAVGAGSTLLSGSASLTPYLFYFIFSAPISFSLCFLTSPSLSLYFFDVLSQVYQSL